VIEHGRKLLVFSVQFSEKSQQVVSGLHHGETDFGQRFDQLASCDAGKLAHEASMIEWPDFAGHDFEWSPISDLNFNLLNSHKFGSDCFIGIFETQSNCLLDACIKFVEGTRLGVASGKRWHTGDQPAFAVPLDHDIEFFLHGNNE
jgi:hypothetical protein